MTAKQKSEGMYPDAQPTAPGGMSMKALINELVTRHGYENDKEAWAQVSWPDLIDLVVEERLAREAEVERPEPAETETYVPAETETYVPADDYEAESVEAFALFENEEDDPLAEFADLLEDIDTYEDDGAALAAKIDEDFVAAVERPLDTEVLAPSTEAEVNAHYNVNIGNPAPGFLERAEKALDDMGEFESDTDLPSLADMDELNGGPDWSDNTDMLDPEVMFAEIVAAQEAEAKASPPVFLGVPGVRDYVFDGHAGAGPSGAERWMNCTMSLTASRKFLETLTPNQQRNFAQAGTAARQGTTAHMVAEAKANHLLGRIDETELDITLLELAANPLAEDEAYDSEMEEYVGEYVDLVSTYTAERGGDSILIESRVEAIIPLTGMHDDEFYVIRGSLDFAATPVVSHNTLVVGDLKYGKGKDVSVDENPQIRIYALGLLSELADEDGNLPDIDAVEYYIIQPRLGGIKPWSESVDDLLAWRDEVLSPALTKALYGSAEGATFSPSELACQWCPARGTCPALAEARVESASGLFDAVVEAEFENGPGSFPETTSLTDARLGDLLSQIKPLIDLYKSMKTEAERRLYRGGSVPGWQLVNYTPPRKWKPGADEALAEIEEVWSEPVLITPTKALEALKKDEVAIKALTPFIEVPDKRPVVAPEGDRRKTWDGKAPEDMFAIEEGS